MYDGWVWGAATWHGCAWCWFAQFSELGVDLIQPRVRGAECFRVLEGDADALFGFVESFLLLADFVGECFDDGGELGGAVLEALYQADGGGEDLVAGSPKLVRGRFSREKCTCTVPKLADARAWIWSPETEPSRPRSRSA